MYIPLINKKQSVYGVPSTVNLKHLKNVPQIIPQKSSPPETSLPNFVNYYADLAGCGFWRIKWPEYLLNINQKAAVTSLAQMVFDGNWYKNIKAIKMQRQASNIQLQFFKDLKKLQTNFNYRLIYEIDDVVFGKDIPDYNHQKYAFLNEEINSNITEMMKNSDEITVATSYMKDYYFNEINHHKITVIPNYIPKFWADRFYNTNLLASNFDKNKKKPRVLYAGSATHLNRETSKGKIKDDFTHVIDSIIKARKDFTFVWKGAFPYEMKQYIQSGEMEFYPWSKLPNMMEDIHKLNCVVAYAPLADNTFNRCKSNIKILENGSLGIPGTYQNLQPYKEATFKFDTGSDLIDQLKHITKNHANYMMYSRQARLFTESMWLENHLDEHFDVYDSEWASPQRNKNLNLIKNNSDQKI